MRVLQPSSLDVIIPDWPAPPGVKAMFTTRRGGVSDGRYASLNLGLHVGDGKAAVLENRRRLMEILPVEPVWLNQVHGTEVVTLTTTERPTTAPVADAVVTSNKGQPCAVLVADCLPLLFCDVAGNRVGAAHAGWRGLAAGVIERTITSMQTPPEQIMAWLGPAIGPDAFEVGEDVVAAFVAHETTPENVNATKNTFSAIPQRPGKYRANIFALARLRLQACGIRGIYGGGLCTVSDPARFFSYRRDGQTGRMAAVVCRA